MNYIWEIVLSAKKNGIEEEQLQYQQAREYSPYMEVSFYDLNIASVDHNRIEVNPFYRFHDIFDRLLNLNNTDYEKTKDIFLDVVLHYLAHTDLRMGLSKQEYYLRLLLKEFREEGFGAGAARAIHLFTAHDRKRILLALLNVIRSGNGQAVFRELFGKIYRNSIIYGTNDRANELLIYVGKRDTEDERERVKFLLDTFLPVGMKTDIFYMEHFGILDEEETMMSDEILLI